MSRTLLVVFADGEAEKLASFAQALGHPFDFLTFGKTVENDLGAETIYHGEIQEAPPADAATATIAEIKANYTHFAAISSMTSKDVMARLAGLLDAAMVTDAIKVETPTTFQRPVVAGAVVATVEVLAEPVVFTVRPAAFPDPSRQGHSATTTIDVTAGATKRVSESAPKQGRPDLSQAKVIVSGGRPLKDAETFEKVIGGLADKLGGAVGATRAAVDSGIAANELQVGQTGKVVAPDLYIAAGISGSTQHVAGIKDSKVIVAINKDPDAPIFDTADLGIVGDLYTVIPELMAKLP